METEANNKITFSLIVSALLFLLLLIIYFVGYNKGFKAADKQAIIVDQINVKTIDSIKKRADSLYLDLLENGKGDKIKTEIKIRKKYVYQKDSIKIEAYLHLDTSDRIKHFAWLRDSANRLVVK